MNYARPIIDRARLYWTALPTIVCNLLRCWAIFLAPAFLVMIAVGTEQGRDALAVAASSAEIFGMGYHAYAAQGVTTVLTTAVAVVVVTRYLPATRAVQYAGYHARGSLA
jgi:hypothetical protein